jgi:hypothetical protein
MTEKRKRTQKTERVIFPKGSNAEQIFDAIREKQDEWAKANPQRVHEKYPKVYDEAGNRIKSPD